MVSGKYIPPACTLSEMACEATVRPTTPQGFGIWVKRRWRFAQEVLAGASHRSADMVMVILMWVLYLLRLANICSAPEKASACIFGSKWLLVWMDIG